MTQTSKLALPLSPSNPQTNHGPSAEPPQKGWLHRWTRKQWCRHWFVLNTNSLTYYRKPEFEHYSFLDGVLDLSLISRIEVAPDPLPATATHAASHHLHNPHHQLHHLHPHYHHHHHHHHHLYLNQQHQQHLQQQHQHQQQQTGAHFAFTLRMWNGECHLLSAGSAAERSLWLAAINECADNGCLEDDQATDSASSSDSSPTSNLSAKSIDAGELAARLPQWRPSPNRCDQLALDQLALTIKSAIRRRDQQNNQSLKFLSDLHSGSVVPKLASETGNNDDDNNNNNNNQLNNKQDNQRSDDEKAQLKKLPDEAQQSLRYPTPTPATNASDAAPPSASCWQSSQRSRPQHQSSQEVSACKLEDEEEEEEPSFKKRPLFSQGILQNLSSDISSTGLQVNHQDNEDEDAVSNDEEAQKSPQKPQKKRVTFDLSLSSLYQMTSSSSSSGSEDSDHPGDDNLSDSGEESSLSPSSSLSSSCSDVDVDADEDLEAEKEPELSEKESVGKTVDGDTIVDCCFRPESRQEDGRMREEEETNCRVGKDEEDEEEAVKQVRELKQQLDAAQQEVGALQRELSSSYANYGQLQLTCQRLEGDLSARDESQKKELLGLQGRVEELSRELALSHRELLEARGKLIKLEEEGRLKEKKLARAGATTTARERGSGSGASSRSQSWLRLHQQVGSHQPLLLMHHVKHTIAANQQLLGAKLLNHSKQIQRKLNELELKVDKIQLNSSLVN